MFSWRHNVNNFSIKVGIIKIAHTGNYTPSLPPFKDGLNETISLAAKFRETKLRLKRSSGLSSIARYIPAQNQARIKPVTVNYELPTLRMIFDRRVDLDILPKSPARKMKLLDAPITPPRILTIDEQKVYLMACAQPLRDVASLMIELGLRPSEVLNLKRDDISLEQNCLQIREGKTKNARRKLLLLNESRKVLEHRFQAIEGENLFPNVKVVYLDHLHKKALKAPGIKIFTGNYLVLYSLRYCFASRHNGF